MTTATNGSATNGTANGGPTFVPGLEGVVAFHTAIAEPDRDGGSLRYRGVDIDDLVGRVGFDDVWALLVDDEFGSALPVDTSTPAFRSGDVRVDVQSSLPLLAPARGFGPLLDISDEQARDHIAQTTAAVLSYAARSARGDAPEVPAIADRITVHGRGALPDHLARRARPANRSRPSTPTGSPPRNTA